MFLYQILKVKKSGSLCYKTIISNMEKHQKKLAVFVRIFLQNDSINAYKYFLDNMKDKNEKKKYYNKYSVTLNLLYVIKHILIGNGVSVDGYCMFANSDLSVNEWTTCVEENNNFCLTKMEEAIKNHDTSHSYKQDWKLSIATFKQKYGFLCKHFGLVGRQKEDKNYVLFPVE